jgi:hypothetical protein
MKPTLFNVFMMVCIFYTVSNDESVSYYSANSLQPNGDLGLSLLQMLV